ncbi:hypothetical protein TrCOL_g10716 [Triparma columacea]|uniref:Uncharacterized protein n=1 Tax=Triparma columacea TaxID=722753 RepID=A0A9W7LEX3_9STRA|nr:hypothetical protein TrCOL_g10716 [Triparma columacea]
MALPPPPAPAWVWCRDEDEGYLPVKVQRSTSTSSTVVTQTGEVKTISAADVISPITNPEYLTVLADDLVQMDDVNKMTVVDSLRRRMAEEKIYTSVGDILIALNPYKQLPLYTPAVIDEYTKRDPVDLAPHVFGVAMDAFRSMISDARDQSILISGESGAGKTEATKQCLHLLSEVARGEHGETALTNTENKILKANPVLEAFGNAKTVRNDNSSRFGKYMQVHFSNSFVIVGCGTINYLLEKSRVVSPQNGERNYHVMYQLCAKGQEVYPELGLAAPTFFKCLVKGGVTNIEGHDDEAEFDVLVSAMKTLGFSSSEQRQIFGIVATVLHLGQVEFQESTDGGDGSKVSTGRRGSVSGGRRRSSTVSSGDASSMGLKKAAEIMGVGEDKLGEALTHRTVMNVLADLDVKAAKSARDALAKELYGRLFNWIVLRINDATKNTSVASTTIGILDIFGFEIFQLNSFEQLCINYANERLQQHFTNHTFDMEELLYKTEGVPYDNISYINNQDVIDLISGKSSLFNTLDDEVVTPRGSDMGFLNKCKNTFSSHSKYSTNFKKPTTFCLNHYAGQVTYEIEGFLEKNKDRMFDDLSDLMKTSTNEILSKELFSGDVENISNERTSTGKYKTQSRKFSDQLNGLVKMLLTTDPHYIRCIKTNPNKAPMVYRGAMVEEQLLYSGVFEATEIRKKGYPFRLSHLRFFRKYWLLAKSSVPSPHSITDWKSACSTLVTALSQQSPFAAVKDCRVGATLVLWRVAQEHPLREARKQVEVTGAMIVQCAHRSANARHTMKELEKIRGLYKKAEKERDLELTLEAYAISQSISFRNHYVVKLERLKYCLEKEVELEKKFETLVTCDLVDVDEAFEKLVEEGRDIGMQTDLFKKAEEMYEQVAEKRACRESLRVQISSDDPDEVEISSVLARLDKLKAKYGEGMGVEEEQPARELYDHIVAELSIAATLAQTLKDTAFPETHLPSNCDTSELESSYSELENHGPRKAASRELLSLSSFTKKIRMAASFAVVESSKNDLVTSDSADPWEDFLTASTDADEVLDLTSASAQDVVRAVEREITQGQEILKLYHSIVADIKSALEEQPCPSEKQLRGAIMAAESFEAKKLTDVPLTSLEVAHATKCLERVLREKALMEALGAALEAERLGPAETLPPGTSIVTEQLDLAIRECNVFGISHPDDTKQLTHAIYMRRLRVTVKEVVAKHKRWRRSVGDDFVAANATIEVLEGVLQERPRDLNPTNDSEANIAVDVTLRFSVVEEIVKRMDNASDTWDEEALAHHVYQAERLNLESSENEEWRDSVKRAREVLATVEALRESLEKAILESDRIGLVESLNKAEEIGYDKPIVTNAKDLLVKIDDVIEQARIAVWSLEREIDMLPVVQKATNISFTNDDIDLLRTYLALPLDKFFGVQLEQAEKAGDMDMMVETWTRLHDIIFESAGNSYHFSHSRVLKSRDDWVGRRFDDPVPDARTRRKMDQMLQHSSDEMKTSLTKLVNADSLNLASLQFKNIMGYMGDRPSMYRDVFADEVVRIGLEYPDLQDETYCQLMKQLSHNPNRESSDRGWYLLEICVRKFPPGTALSMYLESFIRDHGHGDLVATLSTTILKLGRHRTQTTATKVKVSQILSAAGELSGWLIKRAVSQGGGKLSSNKKRYFVLTSDALSYYKNPESTSSNSILGSTKVRNIKRTYAANLDDIGDLGGTLFPFVVESSSGKVSLLCADSNELRSKWIGRIQGARDSYWAENGEEEQQSSEQLGVWREAVDKTNGRTYFYNTVTLETTWVRPINRGSVEELGGLPAYVDDNQVKGGDKYVGKQIMKPFDDEVYEGVVIDFFPAVEKESIPELWRVKYSDGDEEDVEMFELEAAIEFYKEHGGDVEKALTSLKL